MLINIHNNLLLKIQKNIFQNINIFLNIFFGEKNISISSQVFIVNIYTNIYLNIHCKYLHEYSNNIRLGYQKKDALATLAMLTLPLAGMTKMFLSSLFWVPKVRWSACIQPGLRVYQV